MLGALVQYYCVGYPAVGALVLLQPSGGCSGSPDPGVVHPSPSLQSHQQSLAYNNTRVASGWLVGVNGQQTRSWRVGRVLWSRQLRFFSFQLFIQTNRSLFHQLTFHGWPLSSAQPQTNCCCCIINRTREFASLLHLNRFWLRRLYH